MKWLFCVCSGNGGKAKEKKHMGESFRLRESKKARSKKKRKAEERNEEKRREERRKGKRPHNPAWQC